MPETGNNTRNVTVGKPKVGGAVYVAPLGTTLPTSASEALGNAWESVGYISEDGYSNSATRTTENIKEWGGEIVRNPQTEKTDTFKMKFIEALRIIVLKITHGDENVEGTLEEGITVRENAKELNSYAWVIDEVLNEWAIKRTVIAIGKITEIAEIVHKANEVIGFDSTITAYANPAWNGDTHHEYIQGTESPTPPGPTPSLDTLTVTSEAGTETGTTAITVSPEKETGNVYKYKLAAEETAVTYDEDVHFWDTWDGTSDIAAEADQVITVVEATDDYKARKAGHATVVTE